MWKLDTVGYTTFYQVVAPHELPQFYLIILSSDSELLSSYCMSILMYAQKSNGEK